MSLTKDEAIAAATLLTKRVRPNDAEEGHAIMILAQKLLGHFGVASVAQAPAPNAPSKPGGKPNKKT